MTEATHIDRSASAHLFERARTLIPGGVNSPVRAFGKVGGNPFFVDRAEKEGYVLETCMYFPFTTAKNLTGFGADHSAMMRAYR